MAPGEARWTSGFWAEHFELCRQTMVPAMGRLMEGTNYTQFVRNFEIAAGLAQGRPRGAQFNDGDFYKWLEAASAVLAITNDVALDSQLDRIIAIVGKAQRDDGYLHTPVLIRRRNGDTNAVPFKDRNNWELYNMGHLLTAGCVHYHATGKTNLLSVARKAADYLCEAFRDATPEMAQGSVCPSHYIGLVDIFRTTGESRYLDLAKKFFALRSRVREGTDDNQDRIAFERQTEGLGHAARANYLYAGVADLFMETGDQSLWTPLERIWSNVVQKKMYITGGCGALYDGASPDGMRNQGVIGRVHQSYGRNYQLPNITAHSETCANVANVLWNWRMFRATGEAQFMDVAELALYNSVLSGISLDGTNFFYTNPLRLVNPMPLDLRWSRTRVPFVGSFCCPPNLVRTIAEAQDFAYAKSNRAIWVNLYGGSTLKTELAPGKKVKLTQDTEYPWSGRVQITIDQSDGGEFALNLRIPGWAAGATVRINRRPFIPATDRSNAKSSDGAQDSALATGKYVELRRAWQAGDVVDLELPMPARMMEANPLIEEDLNQVALQRGPIVYCLESPDLPKGASLSNVTIPRDGHWLARYDRRLLGGVVVLDGVAQLKTVSDWSGQLYRELRPTASKPVKVSLIPYAVWGNRGLSEMSVWLPLD